jgi:hypothetical protein
MIGGRLLTILARNAALSAVLALILLPFLPRDAGLGWAYGDAFVVMLVFTVLGYYVEILLLRIPGVDAGVGRVVRVTGWFAGGLWCYVAGRVVWRLLGHDATTLPLLPWGGVFLVALELVLHALLRATGRPNFYGGRETTRYSRPWRDA